MERKPIIIGREPVVNDLLKLDSAQSQSNLESIIEEIDNLEDSALGINSTTHAIEDAYERRFPTIWTMKYRTLKGKPMLFKSMNNKYCNRPWQRQILDDNHPNKVVEKSRQLGISEMNVTEVVHFLAVHPQTKAIYTFPTYRQLNDFSVSRLSPIFRDSEVLQNLLSKEVNNVSSKKIGQSYLFMRSSSNGAAGEGVDADAAPSPWGLRIVFSR